MPFLTTQKDGSLHLSLYVQPKASRTGFSGIHGDLLRLAVTAPPVEGKANKEVVSFLATLFKVPKNKITIIGGLQARNKRCRICSVTEREARELIAEQIKKA